MITIHIGSDVYCNNQQNTYVCMNDEQLYTPPHSKVLFNLQLVITFLETHI